MSTTPPEGTSRPSYGMPNVPSMARMPIPGNAEFAVYFLAVIIAWLVCWISDGLGANEWLISFTVLTAFYLLSRGIAKASRVLEQ